MMAAFRLVQRVSSVDEGVVDDKRWRRAPCGVVISTNRPAAKAGGVKHGMHQPGWRWGSRAPRKLEGHKSAREELRPQLKEQEVFLHSDTRITSEHNTNKAILIYSNQLNRVEILSRAVPEFLLWKIKIINHYLVPHRKNTSPNFWNEYCKIIILSSLTNIK